MFTMIPSGKISYFKYYLDFFSDFTGGVNENSSLGVKEFWDVKLIMKEKSTRLIFYYRPNDPKRYKESETQKFQFMVKWETNQN